MQFEKVLVATDFSEPAKKLIRSVEGLQVAGLKEVLLVSVVNLGLGNQIGVESIIEFQKKAERMLEQERNLLEELGLKVNVIIPVGSPADEIVQVAKREKVDLIAIASHGKGYIKEVLLGSTTFDVIRISETPILVEKYKDVSSGDYEITSKKKFKKVLLPTDFSERSLAILDKVKKEADLIEEVVLLSVIEWSKSKTEFEEFKEKSYERLGGLKAEFEEAGFKTKLEVRVGIASKGILQVADEEDVSLIIMATRGMGSIRGLLLGSTANTVARQSTYPIILDPGY